MNNYMLFPEDLIPASDLSGLPVLILIVPILVFVVANTNLGGVVGPHPMSLSVNTANLENVEIARASQALVSHAQVSNESGLTALINLQLDLNNMDEHNNLIEDVFAHYHVTEDMANLLLFHLNALLNFNSMLIAHVFDSLINKLEWIESNSVFLYNVYIIICGGSPDMLIREYEILVSLMI